MSVSDRDERDFWDRRAAAWERRADAISATESVARTETRVATTDQASRTAFRRYWSLVSPGVALIRRISLRLVKAEAERRVRIDAGADQLLNYTD